VSDLPPIIIPRDIRMRRSTSQKVYWDTYAPDEECLSLAMTYTPHGENLAMPMQDKSVSYEESLSMTMSRNLPSEEG
jgi:hypothetical protein